MKGSVLGHRPIGEHVPITLEYGIKYSESLIQRLKLKNKTHKGIDFTPDTGGEPVYAFRDGLVEKAGDEGDGWGTFIKIYHDLPDDLEACFSYYCHLSKLAVKAGMKVKEGQIIGISGGTGKVSAPHLHFETRWLRNKESFRAGFYGEEYIV